jgi:transposase
MMEQLLSGQALNHNQATRLQVILGREDGKRIYEIAEALRIHPVSLRVIVHRFNERGLEGLLKQANHKPGKAPLNQKVINRVLKLVQTQRPKDTTHWSTRGVAKQVGISHTRVHQILQAHDLKPHLVKRFRSSDDPDSEQKLEDIVGLHLGPPENAIVVSGFGRSQWSLPDLSSAIAGLRLGGAT